MENQRAENGYEPVDVSPTDYQITLDDLSGSTRDLIDHVETEDTPVPAEETVPISETEREGFIPRPRFDQVLAERDQYKADAERWAKAKPWERHIKMLEDEFELPEKADLALRANAETTAFTAYERKLAAKVANGDMEQQVADELIAEFGPQIRAAVHAPDVEAERARLEQVAKANADALANQKWEQDFSNFITTMRGKYSELDADYVRLGFESGKNQDQIIKMIEDSHNKAVASQRTTTSSVVAQVAGVAARLPRADSGRTDGRVVLGEGPDPLKDREGYEKHHAELMRQARIKPG